MKKFTRSLKSTLAAAVLGTLLFGTLPARGQQLVKVTDITGGSSVFIFSGRHSTVRFLGSCFGRYATGGHHTANFDVSWGLTKITIR